MVGMHNVVGTLVVVAFLVLTVVNVLRLMGRTIPWGRQLAAAAAGLLLVQYVLGFALLGAGNRNQTSHYVFALLAIVTVGLEHGYARTRVTPRAVATASLIATGLTLVLVVVAYSIGSS